MRCNICDKALTDKEVVWSTDLKAYEPCTTCLEAAMDAAYCDGFDAGDDSYVVIEDDEPFYDCVTVYRNVVSEGYCDDRN
jgi:hypothetical protein